ncbi:hypothetical protein YC2023_109438 [Brassica napus]
MIVDLPMWAIYVVDANQTCPPISVVKDVVNPIPIMMPHMISRFCLTSRPRECNYLPFPISRLDIPVLLEHPGIGYAAVVALILLEIAAVGKPLIDLALTEEEVRVVAENYAISTLSMFKNKQSKHEMLVRYVDIVLNCIINIMQKRRSTGVPYNKHKSCDLKGLHNIICVMKKQQPKRLRLIRCEQIVENGIINIRQKRRSGMFRTTTTRVVI